MEARDKERTGRENLFRKSDEIDGVPIKGYDFNKGVNYDEIVRSFSSTGFQASHLSKAIEIVNKMVKEKAFIYLGYTSNLVSSGLREIFRYLVEHKKVNVVVTTAGGIEEDIIKCLGDFVLGDFRAGGAELREKGINRIGNVYAPNNRYVKFEEFLQPILEELWNEQDKTKKILSACDFIWRLGERVNDKRSICYWAWINKIRIFCPAISDGAIGDNIYFFKFKRPDFKIDVSEDIKELNDTSFGIKKSGVILLGTGIIKHAILNTNMLRNGCDYAVYINTAQEYDGSDAGAMPDEAISWGKIRGNSDSIKVVGDATILFPILVAESFANELK